MLVGGWKKKENSDEISIQVVQKLDECIKDNQDLKYDEIIHIETQVVAGLNARVLVKFNNQYYYHTFHIPLENNSLIQYVNSVKTSLNIYMSKKIEPLKLTIKVDDENFTPVDLDSPSRDGGRPKPSTPPPPPPTSRVFQPNFLIIHIFLAHILKKI